MSDVTAMYMAIPPITRTLVTAIAFCSLGVYTGMFSSSPFWFHYSHLLQFPPAVHRLFTSFLITRPEFAMLFDTLIIYQYMRELETTKFTKKEDMLWYILFVGATVLMINQVFIGAFMYIVALKLAVCYSATQDKRGQTASFYIVTIPAQLQPFTMLLSELVFYGMGAVYVGISGMVAAHLFDFLTRVYPQFGNGPNLIPTPGWLSWIVTTPRLQNTPYGSKFTPPSGNGATRGGPLPDSWRSRGTGRRLG